MHHGRKDRLRFVRWFGSVRYRSALVSLLIVGVALALSGAGVLYTLRGSLYRSATAGAQTEALDISTLLASRKQLPTHLPGTAESAAQVVGADGRVLSSSRLFAGQPPMVHAAPAPGKTVTFTDVPIVARQPGRVGLSLAHRFVIAALGFESAGQSGTILVADSLGAADHAIEVARIAFSITFPLLALLVGILVWFLTGWALRPVENIRAEVDELTAKDLHHRVREPELEDEIGRLARTMNAMLARLETATLRQRQLVADVSHELRNPLAALRAQLEVAAAHPEAGTPAMLAGSILDVDWMSHLVQDLLTLARVDEGTLRLHPSEVDLDELALEHADRLRRRGKVAVSVEGVTAARFRGDAVQLGRVVANLADNAERYAHSRVEFSVARSGDSFDLVVADDGPGVPPAERDHIFERFVRLDSARTHQDGGAGLGLAIAKEIVTAHGGMLWVEDANPGARFVIRLPSSGFTVQPQLAATSV